jgi:hypothetical protein
MPPWWIRNRTSRTITMRAAAYATATLVAVSLYLLVGATVGLSAVWIATGSAGIALAASIAFVARSGSMPTT